jgi:CBS domain-containing protein
MTGQTVGDIYSPDLETVVPSTPVSDVADIMSSRKVHAIPVVENRKVVGIIARIDMIRSMIGKA